MSSKPRRTLKVISTYLKEFEYEFDFDEKEDIITGSFFFLTREKKNVIGLSFSVDAKPDMVSILSQRLSEKFGTFEVYESYYYFSMDQETYFGEEADEYYFRDIADSVMDAWFGEFKILSSSHNLYTPSFQSQKDPNKLIKVMLSDRWKEEDEVKCRKFFEGNRCKILIVWDYELKKENKDNLVQKIKDFGLEDSPDTQMLLGSHFAANA